MPMKPTTWGEVRIGDTVRDKEDRLWAVLDDHLGTLVLGSAHPRRETTMRRPDDDRPVDVYVPTETEAINLLDEELGARILVDIERREHTIARALNWQVSPVARKAVALRDHLDWLHGINVDDVLRKHTGTAANPSSPARKKATVEELAQLHDEAHADPDTWPHAMAHFHAPIGG